MARKDIRSPGPHHECYLQFNRMLPQQKEKHKWQEIKKGVLLLYIDINLPCRGLNERNGCF